MKLKNRKSIIIESRLPSFEIIETSQGRQKEGKIKDASFCDSAKTISPIRRPNSNRCLEFDFMNVTENLCYDG